MTSQPDTVSLPLPPHLVSAWRRLEEDSPRPSFFRTPEWMLSRVAALGLTDRTKVHVWRDRQGLSAVLALVEGRERFDRRFPLGVRVLTNAAAGVGAADHTGWTADPQGHRAVVDWIDRVDTTVLLRNLDPDLAGDLSAPILETSRCPRLDLERWEGPSRSFAKKIRYYRRRAERENLELRFVPPGEVDLEHLSTLQRLHVERFGDDSVMPPISFEIQKELIARSSADLGPVVIQMEHRGEPVAILWGLWFGRVFSFYQTGWLEVHRDLSPGVIMVDEAIQTAKKLGARTFDFLRGPEDYKYRFGAEDRIDATVLVPRRLPGFLLRSKASLKAALRR